jgi:hypothetical protein
MIVKPSVTVSLLLAVCSLGPTQTGRADEPAEIRALLQKLGDPRDKVRAEAEQRLLTDERALRYLKEGSLRDSDAEVRQQCKRVLEKRGELLRGDLFAQLIEMTQRNEFGRATCVGVDFGKTAAKCLVDAVERKTKRAVEIPKFPNQYQIITGPNEPIHLLNPNHRVLAAGKSIEANAPKWCWLLASERLNSIGFAQNCGVFCGGNVRATSFGSSIVFVDGDIEMGNARESLIVCSGAISRGDNVTNCTVIAGGKIRPTQAVNSIIRPKETELADLVRPWKAQELGIEPALRDGRIYAGKVALKSPMAQAGVEADDILLSLDGEKIADQAGAIKLLRQQSAEFLPFFVRVKRGDRELELTVPWALPPPVKR